jgi:hypothetical protein
MFLSAIGGDVVAEKHLSQFRKIENMKKLGETFSCKLAVVFRE